MISKEINLLDLFSGMGGFAKGFTDAGFIIKNHYFSDIEPNAIANYKYNFKNAIYAGPVNFISGTSLPKVDVIAFGSPCQDFSIAGERAGLDGERSSLIYQAIRLIHEKRPSFFIWENVKGAFSSNNSQDFWAIIQAFTNIGCYNIEWQLLNTLWLLPQNRERIYLVGHLATPGRSFSPIFPFTKNDRLFAKPTIAKERQTPAEHFSNHQQDRIYDISGEMGTLSKNRCDDKTKIRIMSTHPRTGDPKTGGCGLIEKEDSSYCLDTANSIAIELHNQYRRLTEIECERLQGFPDNWTLKGLFPANKKVIKYLNKEFLTPTYQDKALHKVHNDFATVEKEIAQTNRYKLIGNAVTKNFPEIIAKRLIENYKIM
ncbi:MAG: DNA (cytosine-5-)-methyltransferase [Pedobacter sp.]|nr:MAG: DNA (cytosine-5-)-methyltransferase [Pedobacter sp.]